MFLKREWPETDDFAIKKISGCEGKILSIFQEKIMQSFLQADTLTKKILKISFHIFAF